MKYQPKCKWQWLKLILAFLNFKLSSSIQFTKIQRHSITSVRLADHYKTIDNTPLTFCSLQCHDDQDCASFNYNTATQTCEMNEKSSKYGIVDLTTEQNWNVYNVQGRCSKGWLNFLGSCYWIEKEHMENWTSALSRCAAINAQLVKIESESENMFIKAELRSQIPQPGLFTRVWTAGNDLDEQNKWVWAEMNGEVPEFATGGVIGYTDWDHNEPGILSGDDCLALRSMNNYKWIDTTCDKLSYYICEF